MALVLKMRIKKTSDVARMPLSVSVCRLWGFLLAGFASAIILSYIPTGFAFNAEAGSVAASGTMSGVALLLLAFIGICIAIYDFMINFKIKENAGSNAGGMSDGI